MSDEIIISAKTLDEAIAKAEAEYGSQGDIAYDILEMPKKGFLGIGATPAKIKVTITPTENVLDGILGKKPDANAKTKTDAKTDKPKAEPKSEVKAEPKSEPKPKEQKKSEAVEKPKNQPKADKPKQDKPKAESKADPKSEQPKAEPVEKTAKTKKKEPPRRERAPIVISEEEMKIALDFVNELLRNMNSPATAVQSTPPEDAVFEGVYPKIEIVGDHSGILIGHHGETLDAIQFLANLCVNRKTGATGREFVKINVDIEGYRAKREETLRALARRMAQKAIKYKRNVVLEPMNPYERHIIHSEIQEMENVDTHSVGSDENRKVVITYEGADKTEKKSSRRRPPRDRRREAPKASPVRKISEEESAKIQETYAAYQEEKAGRERPKRATSIDEILGMSDDPDEPLGL